jgi:hypothetical protein
VPSPDQKFVNIYRVIYHTVSENSVRDESSVFKISKLDSPKRILVSSLRSDQPYQIWLEAYLTNGKTVQSNVEEFRTKPAPPTAQPVEGSGEARGEKSYYSGMVAAAIVATFALMGLAVVLYFYLRRHTTYKATITKERPASKASTAYDNSAFKDFDTSSPPAQVLLDCFLHPVSYREIFLLPKKGDFCSPFTVACQGSIGEVYMNIAGDRWPELRAGQSKWRGRQWSGL